MPKIDPFLYGNGGNIIMVQVKRTFIIIRNIHTIHFIN